MRRGSWGRERFLILTLAYKLIPYLGFDYSRGIEWNFVLRNFPKGELRVLDVGACESLFIYELAGRGYDTYGIDVNPYDEHLPSSVKFYQNDIIKAPFADNFFDAVIAISTIEHTGLGYYGDPKLNDGDFRAMNEMWRILKKDGRLYLTTIVGKDYTVMKGNAARVYDQERLSRLTSDFLVEEEEYHVYKKGLGWVRVEKRIAFDSRSENYCLACIVLRKT